jgi:glyoxylase-like metal-dependent hydrolase (beta-lactamase superfamily II)
MRRLVIGQPRPLLEAVRDLSGTFVLRDGSEVQVIETPGHCDDHVSLWIPADRLLLAGDGFMGTHFSTPNGDVDHRAWILSLERLIALRPEIMVEGHGHVHTERQDVLAELDSALPSVSQLGADLLRLSAFQRARSLSQPASTPGGRRPRRRRSHGLQRAHAHGPMPA